MQAGVVATMMSAAVKINEAQLRREQKGKLDEILNMVREHEATRTIGG